MRLGKFPTTPLRVLVGGACLLFAVRPSRAQSLIGTTTAGNAFSSASRFYTHCANGYYWVAYHNGTEPVLYSSLDAAVWTLRGPIFSSFDPTTSGEWAVRFSGTDIIAFGYNSGNSQTYYRNGTLNSDGTVSWNAPDAATGAGTWPPLNALISNGKPILWQADLTADGAFRIGSQLNGPVWTNTVNAPPMTTGLPVSGSAGGFSAGAILQTGGADPDDLIVLRTTTAAVLTPNAHRLVAIKYDASLGTFDPSWYNVSTLGGTLTEDATTQVRVEADDGAHVRFAAVRDSGGNIHAVYVNQNSRRVVHYKKNVGLNDSWSRISIDVTGVDTFKVALSAAPNNNLYLFYLSGFLLYHRRFDGTSWGPPTLLYDATGSDINDALAPMESANGCPLGLAFSEGLGPPNNIRFTLLTDTCGELQTAEGAGTFTITSPASFEMTFDTARGGSMDRFFDLAADPGRLYDLAGKDSTNAYGLFHSSMTAGGVLYATGTNSTGAKLDLLEATPTRVRVRQESFYQQVPPATTILAGVKGIGDYTVYSQRTAIRWNRKTTAAVLDQDDHPLEIIVHREASGPLASVSLYSESGGVPFPHPAGDDFVLAQREVPGVTTDFLGIQYADWALADNLRAAATGIYFSWADETANQNLPAGLDEKWNFLVHYKPTNFGDNTDPAVLSRRDDYRFPDPLSVTVGGPWLDASENTSGGDDFNESEAAYVLTFAPSLGLSFDMDGAAANPRYHPFFKIRQWRSLSAAPQVTLETVPLAKNVDYKADVKPVSKAHFAQRLLWHSTLESLAALDTSPDIGSAGSVSGTVNFVPARYGNGAQVADTTSLFNFPTAGNFDPGIGAIEFWFKPDYPSDDGSSYSLGGYNFNGANYWLFEKDNTNNLRFRIVTVTNTSEIVAPAGSFSWRARDWVHLRFEWDETLPVATQLKIFVNGVEPNPGGGTGADYVAATNVSMNFQIGRRSPQSGSPGIYDEIRVYGGSATAPTAVAHAGLILNPAEYLASTTNNFQFGFNAVDPMRRGEYLYFGSDTKFRGLNVTLQTPGAGTVDLQWEYWNGASWADLESGFGFTDETNHFTRDGSVYWTGDPFNWSLYSVNGDVDLFYVRVHLASGAYAPFPQEKEIRTDILLFQYCGDITAPAQSFSFSVPPPVGPPPADVSISSESNQTFAVGTPAPVFAATVTITDIVGGAITSANEIRIRIPSGFPLRWDTTVTSVSLLGSAAPRVNPTIKLYEDFDQTLVLNVVSNFAAGEQLIVSGLQFFGFTIPAPADYLELETNDDGSPSAFDDKTLTVTAAANPTLSSNDHQLFIVSQPPTPAQKFFVTESSAGASITSADDIRVRIPATFPMQWDAFITSVSLSGSAASKVSASLRPYEDGDKTLVLDVLVDFAPGDFLSVSGPAFKSFSAIALPDNLELEVDNLDNVIDLDDKTISIDGAADVPFFTATATSLNVKLEWLNPSFGSCAFIHLLRRDDGIFPTGPGDPLATPIFSPPLLCIPANKEFVDDNLAISNGITYSYAIFVEDSGGGYTAGKRVKARPFDTSGPVKWAYSTGATSMAAPGLRFYSGSAFVYAVSNDKILHAMNGGPTGGDWPAGWTPYVLGAPAQSRPPVLGFAVGSSLKGVALLGAQDGNVYAINAETGAPEWVRSIASMVQAAPAGNFKGFNPTALDFVLVGTRNSSNPNSLAALDVNTGAPQWNFDNSVPQNGNGLGVGIISSGAAVDYQNKLVYFASRVRSGGSSDTVWCVNFAANPPQRVWSKPIGNVDGSPMLFAGGLYVGTNSGELYALDPLSGDVNWSLPLGDGPVKGFVFPQFGSSNLLLATSTKLWSVNGTTVSVNPNWPVTSADVPSPSTPIFVVATSGLFSGAGDGKLYQLDATAPLPSKSVTLGDGSAAVGSPTADLLNSMVYVGTDQGVIYGISFPLP